MSDPCDPSDSAASCRGRLFQSDTRVNKRSLKHGYPCRLFIEAATFEKSRYMYFLGHTILPSDQLPVKLLGCWFHKVRCIERCSLQ